jgi:hypothetical protein
VALRCSVRSGVCACNNCNREVYAHAAAATERYSSVSSGVCGGGSKRTSTDTTLAAVYVARSLSLAEAATGLEQTLLAQTLLQRRMRMQQLQQRGVCACNSCNREAYAHATAATERYTTRQDTTHYSNREVYAHATAATERYRTYKTRHYSLLQHTLAHYRALPSTQAFLFFFSSFPPDSTD